MAQRPPAWCPNEVCKRELRNTDFGMCVSHVALVRGRVHCFNVDLARLMMVESLKEKRSYGVFACVPHSFLYYRGIRWSLDPDASDDMIGTPVIVCPMVYRGRLTVEIIDGHERILLARLFKQNVVVFVLNAESTERCHYHPKSSSKP